MMKCKVQFLLVVLLFVSCNQSMKEQPKVHHWSEQNEDKIMYFAKEDGSFFTNYWLVNKDDTLNSGFFYEKADVQITNSYWRDEKVRILSYSDSILFKKSKYYKEEEIYFTNGKFFEFKSNFFLIEKNLDSLILYPRFGDHHDSLALGLLDGEIITEDDFIFWSISENNGRIAIKNSIVEDLQELPLFVYSTRKVNEEGEKGFSGFLYYITSSRLKFSWLQFLEEELELDSVIIHDVSRYQH